MTNVEQFFFEHAGWGYNPAAETPEQGRERGACRLAAAERWASDNGYSFEWQHDPDIDSSEWTKRGKPYATWQCTMRNEFGKIVQSLGGVDFGPGGEPWGESYRRVLEAEMALEEMPE